MLLLSSAAFAVTVSLPIKATYAEYTGWGEDPVVVDDVLSATVTIDYPATGETYAAKGELLLKGKTGAGAGELVFDADPSGSLRTWAVYLLDAEGLPLAKEPEIIDVLFGDDGDGTIVARAEDCCSSVRRVKVNNRTLARRNVDDGTHAVSVEVADLGTRAAYVGIQELASDGSPLAAHADLEAMTAGVYAAYQGLALDGLVPLDTWKATVDGTVAFVRSAAGGGTIEREAVEVTLGYYGAGTKGAGVLATATYASATRRKINHPFENVVISHKMTLKPTNQIFDVYDGAVNVIVDGDARGWDVGGFLLPVDDAPAPITDTLLTLSPSDVAIGATAVFTTVFPAKPENEGVRSLGIQPLGEDGTALDAWLECTLTPTAVSNAETLNYVGECLRDDEGRAYVRGLRMTLAADGTGTISSELLGLQWQKSTTLAFDLSGDGWTKDVGVVTGASSVTETSFSLDWTFSEDIDGAAYGVELSFYGATTAPTFQMVGDGMYRWPATDWTTTVGDGVVYAKKSKADADAIKKDELQESGAEVELK